MSSQMITVVAVCLVGLILVLTLWARRSGKWGVFGLSMTFVTIWAVFLNLLFGFPFVPPTQSKGPADEHLLVIALFLCMLAGMFANHFYHRFERPKRYRTKWDWGLFLAPVFTSPIIFIPLLAAFTSVDIKVQDLSAPRLMIFFVAFQNGFFWKEFFDQKQRQEAGSKITNGDGKTL